jgi:hypothetical protein
MRYYVAYATDARLAFERHDLWAGVAVQHGAAMRADEMPRRLLDYV